MALKRDVNKLSTQGARWDLNLIATRPFYFLSELVDYHKGTAAGPVLNYSLPKWRGALAVNHQIEFYARRYFKTALNGEAETFRLVTNGRESGRDEFPLIK